MSPSRHDKTHAAALLGKHENRRGEEACFFSRKKLKIKNHHNDF
jgi:hypothetical protein